MTESAAPVQQANPEPREDDDERPALQITRRSIVTLAAFLLASIAALANAGTLAAFIAVCAAMLVLRRRDPGAERKFRAPAAPLVGAVGILGCLYLFISLPNRTQTFFVTAQAIGIVLYFIYGGRAALRARAGAGA